MKSVTRTNGSKTKVLIVDDDPEIAELLRYQLERHGCEIRVAADGQAGQALCAMFQPDLTLLDLGLPDIDGLVVLRRAADLCPSGIVAVMSASATVPRAVQAMTAGAVTVFEKPISDEQLTDLLRQVRSRRLLPDAAEGHLDRLGALVTRSEPMKRLFELMRMTAPPDVNVLIIGENGTGKELVATAIHELSLRRSQPFVRINCAAIPSELLESELFGHRRGAFTGAVADRRGLLELANRGSVLLDEIAEMPPMLQAKMLRVLQEREVRPVGGDACIKVDFRLISATNVEPAAAVAQGRLREDLLFRINTITLRVPALRERVEDIPLLAETFLRRFAALYRRPVTGFDDDALRWLECYHWPGNVRELEHAVERAVILAANEKIAVKDLPEGMRVDRLRPSQPVTAVPANCTLAELERLAILQTLEQTNWNKRAAAEILGIHRPTLYNKLRRYQLRRSGRLPDSA